MSDLAATERALMTALNNTREVIDRWPDLVEAKTKGTPRPTVATKPRDRNTIDPLEGFGSVPAPLHLDILDALANILMWADELAEHVAQTLGHNRIPPAANATDDARPYLRYVEHNLTEAAQDDPDIVEAVTDKVNRMRSLTLSKLGEVYDGQTLEAICPFCIGQTFKTPAGERTMRVRLVPSRVTEGDKEFVIVCENTDGCRPFAAECDMWVRSQPAWPWSQWEWLATKLLPTKAA